MHSLNKKNWLVTTMTILISNSKSKSDNLGFKKGDHYRDSSTISLWCTNTRQPSLETLVEKSETLNADV